MSLTLQTLHTVQDLTAQHAAGDVWAAGGDGVFTKINNLTGEAKQTIRNVGAAAAIAAFVATAWRAKGAIAGMLVGALAAGLFIWLLNNVDSAKVQDPVDQEVGTGVNGLAPPPPPHVITLPAPPPSAAA